MTKQEILGSALGLLIASAVTILLMSFWIPPSHPNFIASMATIIVVFVIIEIVRIFWVRKSRRQNRGE